MTEESLVSTDVDHDRDGKQFGRIQVPVSTNSSGWAQYFIPVVNVRNGDGPTAVLFGGNHGGIDEIGAGTRSSVHPPACHHGAHVESSGGNSRNPFVTDRWSQHESRLSRQLS